MYPESTAQEQQNIPALPTETWNLKHDPSRRRRARQVGGFRVRKEAGQDQIRVNHLQSGEEEDDESADPTTIQPCQYTANCKTGLRSCQALQYDQVSFKKVLESKITADHFEEEDGESADENPRLCQYTAKCNAGSRGHGYLMLGRRLGGEPHIGSNRHLPTLVILLRAAQSEGNRSN